MSTKPKILVTGATGGLGYNLCQSLLADGYSILALGRQSNIGKKLVASYPDKVQFIKADIRFPLELDNTPCDFIVHCAALSSPWGKYSDFYQTNVQGTQHVIDLALKWNCPIIHISTPSVYFNFSSAINIKEDQSLPLQFASYYTDTKKKAEDLIHAARNMGLKSVILRPRGIFGPHDTGLVPRILRIASKGYFPKITLGDKLETKTLIDITYVDNVIQAIYLSMTHIDKLEGHTFNITNDEPLNISTILEMLFKELNLDVKLISIPLSMMQRMASLGEKSSRFLKYALEPPMTHYTLGLISYSQTLDISKAKTLLGYKPSITIGEGIKRYKIWHQGKGHF